MIHLKVSSIFSLEVMVVFDEYYIQERGRTPCHYYVPTQYSLITAVQAMSQNIQTTDNGDGYR